MNVQYIKYYNDNIVFTEKFSGDPPELINTIKMIIEQVINDLNDYQKSFIVYINNLIKDDYKDIKFIKEGYYDKMTGKIIIDLQKIEIMLQEKEIYNEKVGTTIKYNCIFYNIGNKILRFGIVK